LVHEALIQVEKPMTIIVTLCVGFSGTNVISLGKLKLASEHLPRVCRDEDISLKLSAQELPDGEPPAITRGNGGRVDPADR
jgi:hypothetical protein